MVGLGGGNSNIFGIFIPKFGEDEPNLTSIFVRWGGSTTKQWLVQKIALGGRLG